ncbi:hypothetical protein QUA30_22600 [Microcoleus sp. Pol14C2]|uniref:hypothetical protein n=1 Tax=unclassified Microcoleus TaxID=2642155 RepID=UPI002FCFA74D
MIAASFTYVQCGVQAQQRSTAGAVADDCGSVAVDFSRIAWHDQKFNKLPSLWVDRYCLNWGASGTGGLAVETRN